MPEKLKSWKMKGVVKRHEVDLSGSRGHVEGKSP